jgi:hypothetical protein
MSGEDKRVFLIDFARRRSLNSQNVIARFLDSGPRARALRSGFSCGQLPRGEIESVSSPKDGVPYRQSR